MIESAIHCKQERTINIHTWGLVADKIQQTDRTEISERALGIVEKTVFGGHGSISSFIKNMIILNKAHTYWIKLFLEINIISGLL